MSDLLADIPDPQELSPDAVVKWLNDRIALINQTSFSPELTSSFISYELALDFPHEMGAEASPVWRKFFLATLLADWASYPRTIDRVDYARLKYIMASSYKTFRLWFCRLPDATMAPVGYTAWYPIASFVYEGVLQNPDSVTSRGIFMPLRNVAPHDMRYAFAFNISIADSLRNTACNIHLIKACRNDLVTTLKDMHVIATVVGDSGAKFLRSMRFNPAGHIIVGGESEDLFVRPPL